MGFAAKGSASGFSLIELLIVVAIILIIAAIAIPNCCGRRWQRNEVVGRIVDSRDEYSGN